MKKNIIPILILLIIININASHSEKLTKKLVNNLTYFVFHGVIPGVFGFLNYRATLHDNIEKYKIDFNITAENMQHINWSHYREHYSPSFGNDIQMTAATCLLMYSGYSTFIAARGCKKMLGYYKNKVVKEKESNIIKFN